MQNAYNAALKLISVKSRTEKELERKLKDKKISDSVISGVITKLKEYNLINDSVYAADYVLYAKNFKKKGKFYIYRKLLEKGVNKEIIDDALSGYTEGEEYAAARELAQKKIGKKETDDKSVLKVASFLRSRGFSEEVIYQVIKKIK